MPSYQFEDEDGNRVEVYMSMSEAPSWGECCEVDGRRLRRVIEIPVTAHIPDYACVTRINGFYDPSYPRFDEMGRGVILNRREHADLAARSEGRIVWD